MIVNLTPHPLNIYPADCPDRVEPGSVDPLFTIDPSGRVARLVENTLGTWFTLAVGEQPLVVSSTAIPVEGVEYGHIDGLPPADGHEPPRTWYVVSLVAALAAPGRPDLLVPYREVRSTNGGVVGCRQLARPA